MHPGVCLYKGRLVRIPPRSSLFPYGKVAEEIDNASIQTRFSAALKVRIVEIESIFACVCMCVCANISIRGRCINESIVNMMDGFFFSNVLSWIKLYRLPAICLCMYDVEY
jgi:hypothetical protein